MSTTREKMIEQVATVLLECDCMGQDAPRYRDLAAAVIDAIGEDPRIAAAKALAGSDSWERHDHQQAAVAMQAWIELLDLRTALLEALEAAGERP